MEVVETRTALKQFPHDQRRPAFRQDLCRLRDRAELAVTLSHVGSPGRYDFNASTILATVQIYD
jgi:hypothetical protein